MIMNPPSAWAVAKRDAPRIAEQLWTHGFAAGRGREDGGGLGRLRSALVANLTTFKTWAKEGLPKGTLYHYPNPNNHQILLIAGAPAPHKIGEQIYVQAIQTQMAVRHFKGEAMEKTLAWAASELEGFSRK